MSPRLELRQSQSLVMTPQLQQAIRLLALSNLELESVVAEAVANNPLLTAGEEGVVVRPDTSGEVPPETPAADTLIAAGKGEADAPLDADFAGERFHHDCSSDAPRGGGSEDIDFDSFAGAVPTLAEHLLGQLGPVLDARALAIARVVVDSLDDAGYLTVGINELAERCDVGTAEIEAVLAEVQRCEPTGVGARSLAECLRLQAIDADRHDPCMAMLIEHLELLAGGRIDQLQRLCRVDDEDMADMIRELRGYDPKPGCRHGASRVDAVVPDVFVSETAKGWHVEVNGGNLPRVLIDRRYHAQLAASASDKASKAWIAETMADANWLVKALDQRQRTIVSVASEIVKQQVGFFRHGVTQLRPLTLRTIADAVSLHESTVSRVTSNKYLSCARGTFELKYFFTSGVASADGGEGASAQAVKAAIRKLVAVEPADAILSDDTLVDRLRDEGFDLARRTVAKYREAIGIGSSVQRRRARAIDTKAA